MADQDQHEDSEIRKKARAAFQRMVDPDEQDLDDEGDDREFSYTTDGHTPEISDEHTESVSTTRATVDDRAETITDPALDDTEGLESVLEDADTRTDAAAPETTPETKPVATPPPSHATATTAEDAEIDRILKEAGIAEIDAAGGRNRLPTIGKVRSIVRNQLRKGGAALRQAFDQERTSLTQRVQGLEAENARYQEFGARIDAMSPEEFVAMAKQHDARWAQFGERLAELQAIPPVELDPKPAPDHRLDQGLLAYSAEQQARLDAWESRQRKREVEAALAPERQARAEAERRDRVRAHFLAQDAIVEEQNRFLVQQPLFADVEQEILRLLQDDSRASQQTGERRKLSAERAYIQAVMPRLLQTRAAQRAEILKELRAQANKRVGDAGSPTTTTQRERTPRTVRGTAARVLERLEREHGSGIV